MRKKLFPILIAALLVGMGGGFEARGAVSEQSALGPLTEQTRVFQQGVDGYTGVSDTWVSTQDWADPDQYTCNYGQNDGLMLERGGRNNPLLHFDLSGISSNSQVISATLSLYNETASSLPRRVEAYRVLLDWEEGTQVNTPILASGEYGATGDYAVQYYPGEGTDVPWSVRGMAAGADYAEKYETAVDVLGEGWYTWDVTDLVRAWVHGDHANYGLTLRDGSGYQSGNPDWRDFVSSQGADAGLRPKLTVVYNPDAPYADAGPDQENLSWDGSAITLDGSGSYDPGGGDLTYAWRVVPAAYGSTITGTVGTAEVTAFTPDLAGEWEFELTATNDQNESASDRVFVRLLSIPADHPRIYLTPQKLAALQARAVSTNTRWTQLVSYADGYDEMMPKALVSQVTGQAAYCEDAIDLALAYAATSPDYATSAGDVALVYDWCHDQLTAGERTTFVDFFNAWGDDQLADPGYTDVPGLGNYWPRYGYSFGLMGLASYGDNPRAQEWMDEFRHRRFRDVDRPWLNRISAGGGWPEGMIYDWIANLWRVEVVEGWRTATGEDLFASTPWFRERLGYILMHRWPGVQDEWGHEYHPYLSTGDTERNRGSMANYERIMALILIERYPAEPLAHQLQAYLSAPPTDGSMRFLYPREFLWFNPDQLTAPPTPLTHYAAGTGAVFMRSGWPDGAADLDTGVTYLTFQCGDFFTYHQHYDQNSFTIFKHDDLALDSGVYSGDGRSYHDRNYYVRTIAHNSLVVYNPAEDFSAARPDADSNDGGQRTMSPASRLPPTVDYFDQYATQYETGDIVHFDDAVDYTYVLGDATAAYNNPTYNQAMDTTLGSNVAKVTRFQREFVYLRPEAGGQANDYVVLYDRVGVVSPTFSGANTKLLFHVMEQPTISGTPTDVSPGETLYADATLATAVNGDGKLFIKPLLPDQRNLRVVGGRGEKAFWVFGENYDWHFDPGEPQPRPLNDFESVPYGEWRIELEPADAALDHNFLTVLQPTISTTVSMAWVSPISATKLAGAHIADPDLNRVALFSAAHDGGAPQGVLAYHYLPTTHTLNLVFDLVPYAAYAVSVTEESFAHYVTLTPGIGDVTVYANGQGVLRFIVEAGGTIQDWPKVYLPLVLRDD